MNNKNGGGIITFKYRYRKQIIIGIVLFIIILAITFSIYYFVFLKKDTKKEKNKEIIIENNIKKETTKEEKEIIYKVDVKGQVISPGIYELKSSARVIDAINMAGGLTEEADTSVINLSKKVIDEMVIIIYSKDQVKDFEKTKENEKQVQEKCEKNEEYSIKNDACIMTSNQIQGKININSATKEELMTIPGIGESKANDIIKYREKNGFFNNIEDIKKVSGIGESLFASIKENITT